MSDRVKLSSWFDAKSRALARWVQDPVAILLRLRRLPKPDTSVDDLVGRAPVMTVVIASTPRTGSTLLAERLAVTGMTGVPDEYFNDRKYADAAATKSLPALTILGRIEQQSRRFRMRRNWECVRRYRPTSVRRYCDDVVARRTGPNGVFCVKIHSGDFDTLARRFGLDERIFPQPVQWVHVMRGDRLAQAVSLVRASQSGEWVKGQRTNHRLEPVRYDELEIEKALHKVLTGQRLWEQFFAGRGIDPVEVVYEDMVADIDGTRDRVLRELGLGEPDSEVAYEAPTITRQSDAVNEEWIERFRRSRPELESIC